MKNYFHILNDLLLIYLVSLLGHYSLGYCNLTNFSQRVSGQASNIRTNIPAKTASCVIIPSNVKL